MDVVIIANQTSVGLAPLLDDDCLAMLPVAGKPLLEHTLEAVARIKPAKVTVVASRGLASIKRFVGMGDKWGLDLAVLSSRPNESIGTLRVKQKDLVTSDTLIVECDRIRDFGIQEFLDKVIDHTDSQVGVPDSARAWYTAMTTTGAAGLNLYQEFQCESEKDISLPAEGVEHRVFDLADCQVLTISTLKDFHRINLAAASGEIPNLTKRGRERAIGLTTGFMSKVHPRSLKQGKALVGNHCRVAPSCSLHGRVVINNGVVVDRRTRIENSVILDRTFLGENLDVKNSIVKGNKLIRVDTGAIVTITDRFLVASLGESLYRTHFADITNRLMGLILLLLSLPLWPIAFTLAVVNRPRKPFERKTYVGNKLSDKPDKTHRAFVTTEFNTNNALLRHVPLVVAIASGHIRLVGVSLCEPGELGDRTDSWQTIRDAYPCGALGPTQLHLPAASTDEKIMSDAIFAQQASARHSAYVCWEAVCAFFHLRTSPRPELS